jgi:magnesium chelatase family protein
MGGEQRRQLAATMDKLSMSARATHRVIKIPRSIADYDGSDEIRDQDLMGAISYRRCQFSKLWAR